MYLVLLAFGAVLAAAGTVLTASGVSLHDRAIDASVVTPGIVAIVGGLLLIGLGFGLRALRRIEQMLASRPVSTGPRAPRLGETAELGEPGPISSALKPAPRLQAASITTAAPFTGEKRADELLKRNSVATKFDATRFVEETELSPKAPSLFVPSTASEAAAEVDKVRAARRSGAARITPRLDVNARSPAASERPSGPTFDALWPKGPRPMRTAPQPAPAQADAAPAVEPEQNSEPVLEAPPPLDADESVSVLKSGVVDGMAYTLYSDGSIEAQLPQGTLRFGSITELRNHIEQSA
jgi:hypothetical protein